MLGEGRLVHWEKLGRAKRDSMYVHDFAWTLLSVMLEGMDGPVRLGRSLLPCVNGAAYRGSLP
jgi:hypothetical protein